MFRPITIKSKKNGFKVTIGTMYGIKREAVFYITPERMFTAAEAIGIDQSVLKRKSIQNCEVYEFRMIFGDRQSYRISKKDFLANAWLYPKSDTETAPASDFEPKWVIVLAKIKELAEKPKSKEECDELILKAALK